MPDSPPVKAPLSFELGGVTITPTGFINFAQVWRSKAVTSRLLTNFAAIPFNNTVLGHRRQTLSSAQNTRLGLRLNTRVLGWNVLGLVEGDFNGYVPNNVATTSNSYGFRLRLAFANLGRNRWEILGRPELEPADAGAQGDFSFAGHPLSYTRPGSERSIRPGLGAQPAGANCVPRERKLGHGHFV